VPSIAEEGVAVSASRGEQYLVTSGRYFGKEVGYGIHLFYLFCLPAGGEGRYQQSGAKGKMPQVRRYSDSSAAFPGRCGNCDAAFFLSPQLGRGEQTPEIIEGTVVRSSPRRPLPDDAAEEDEPRQRRRRRRAEDDEEEETPRQQTQRWQQAARGALMNFISLCLLSGAGALRLLFVLLWVILQLADPPRVAGGISTLMNILVIGSVLICLGGLILALVGHVLAFLGPLKELSLLWNIAALIAAGGASVLSIMDLVYLLSPYSIPSVIYLGIVPTDTFFVSSVASYLILAALYLMVLLRQAQQRRGVRALIPALAAAGVALGLVLARFVVWQVELSDTLIAAQAAPAARPPRQLHPLQVDRSATHGQISQRVLSRLLPASPTGTGLAACNLRSPQASLPAELAVGPTTASRFHAAFASRSWCTLHTGQVHSRMCSGSCSKTYPQQEHLLLLG
jgi:hypothetical protein